MASTHGIKGSRSITFVGVAVIALLVGAFFDSLGGSKEKDNAAQSSGEATQTASSAEENIKPIGEVKTVDRANPPKAASGEEVFKAVCTTCHTPGVLNAPKLEKAAWSERIGKGLEGLTQSAINGFKQMPPRGGKPDLSDEEITNAVVYMLGQAGYDLAPEAKAATAGQTSESGTTSSSAGGTQAAPAAPQKPSAPSAPVASPVPQAPAQPEAPAAPEAAPAPVAPAAPGNAGGADQSAPAASPAPQAPDKPAAPEATVTPSAPVAESSAAVDGEKVYRGTCFSCHDVGVANSPKLGDKEAWAPRIATGKETLYSSALNGKGVMPARGGKADLSDAEVKAAVDWMVSQAQ